MKGVKLKFRNDMDFFLKKTLHQTEEDHGDNEDWRFGMEKPALNNSKGI